MGDFAALLIVGWIGLGVGFYNASVQEDEYQRQAVSRGYAEYCIDTTNFAWKGECDE